MGDKVIDAAAAQGLQAYACRANMLVTWVVMKGQLGYPGEFVARLVTDAPTPYILLADTLAGLQDQLPIDVKHADRRPADPPEVVEIWLAT